jgi:hypothetical protein
MKKYDWSKNRIEDAVKNSLNYKEVLRRLGIPASGNNSTTLKKRIAEFGIDTSHFTFAPKHKGVTRPIDYYLTEDSHCSRRVLKLRLIKDGYKRNVCEVCGISEWNGLPLTMQLHHKDGNPYNNCLENLMIICPNCHSQTNNFRGRSNRDVPKPINYCQDCGRQISRSSKRCLSCASKHRLPANVKIDMTVEEFLEYKKQGLSNTAIAGIYNVTEAAIRKWRRKNLVKQ